MGKAFITFIIVLLVKILVTAAASSESGGILGLMMGVPLTGAFIVYFNDKKQ